MRVLGLGLVELEVGHRVCVVYVVAWAFLGFEAFATFFLGFLELVVQTIVHMYFDPAEGVLGVPHRMGLGPELEDYKQGVLEVGVGPEAHHIAVAVVDFVVDFVVKIHYLTVEHHSVLEHEHGNEHHQKHY